MVRYFDGKIFSNPGSNLHALMKPIVDKDGSIDLEVYGYEDTNEIIQSYAESCDITVILNNAANGDFSGLNAVRGMYGDFTAMPKTYAEMIQMQLDAKKAFDGLPVDVKNRFDNDVNKFMSSAGEEDWLKKLGVDITEKGDTSLDNNDPKVTD